MYSLHGLNSHKCPGVRMVDYRKMLKEMSNAMKSISDWYRVIGSASGTYRKALDSTFRHNQTMFIPRLL